jgi:hypothetical protein
MKTQSLKISNQAVTSAATTAATSASTQAATCGKIQPTAINLRKIR